VLVRPTDAGFPIATGSWQHRHIARTHPIYLEAGQKWVFACSLSWPGWCRRGRGENEAIETLQAYASRYRAAVGSGFAAAEIEVVGRLVGTAATDFGVPTVVGPWDNEPVTKEEVQRQIAILEASWRAFDAVVKKSGPRLRKGPRGGGRDRDQIADHVREAERAYARKVGARVPPRTAWLEQRVALVGALQAATPEVKWPVRYAIRRVGWHVLDHAWEIEDRNG